MLNPHDREFLFRALNHNSVVLFLGAGFSPNALNKAGRQLPTSRQLAAELWKWAGYPGEYDGDGHDLGEIFEGCLGRGKPLSSLRAVLEDLLLVAQAPEWYDTITRLWWFRIYSTNVDDLVEFVFRRGNVALERVRAPVDDYRERDQFLRSTQYIKLNGSLPGDPRHVTFSPRQYARRTAKHDVWYDHFVRDYVYHPTIFIGSELREPMFWQAITEREERGENPEERPRSFLVVPEISGPKFDILESLNIRHVPAQGADFFEWLRAEYAFPAREETLRTVVPDAAAVLDLTSGIPGVQDALTEFLSVFHRVPLPSPRTDRPKTFFLGAPPTWDDIASDFDAPREFVADIVKLVRDAWSRDVGLAVIGLLGEGGSGKSTALRRAALTLRQEGRQVFFSEGAERPRPGTVRTALEAFPDRTVMILDNAQLMGRSLVDFVHELRSSRVPPVLLFGARYTVFERQLRELVGEPGLQIVAIPDLSDPDIDQLITTLHTHRQLGLLEPMRPDERRYEFKIRANKQLLVAMREATQGKGFDDILRSEYAELEEPETRRLYLSAAIASAELIDLSRGQWLACAELEPASALGILRTSLRGLLFENEQSDRIAARHPVIAEYVISNVAARADLSAAYVRVLGALAHDIYGGPGRRQRSWRLFVRLINHTQVYDRFSENIDMARQIYEAISDSFRADGHFWLQYANLEIEFGHPELARPHLAHAEGLMPNSDQVQTTRAHLELRMSLDAASLEEAVALRREAEEILFELIAQGDGDDEYPYHVYLTQGLAWIRRWGPLLSKDDQLTFYERLDEYAEEALDLMPRIPRLRRVAEGVRREYLLQATRRS